MEKISTVRQFMKNVENGISMNKMTIVRNTSIKYPIFFQFNLSVLLVFREIPRKLMEQFELIKRLSYCVIMPPQAQPIDPCTVAQKSYQSKVTTQSTSQLHLNRKTPRPIFPFCIQLQQTLKAADQVSKHEKH